jgi:hypothetical protein
MRLQTICFYRIAGVLLLLGGMAPEAGAADSPDTARARAPEAATAAMRGIGWLVTHKDAMPPRLALTTYRKIYKATPDHDLAAELLEIIRTIEDELPEVDTAIDIHERDSRRWHNLRPMLIEVVRRKCAGDVRESDLAAIKDLYDFYWDRLFRSTMDLSKKVVAAYLLGKVGVGDDLYHSVVSQIRSRSDLLEDPGSYRYVFYLYAITHTVLTSSGYYDHYVDPSGFEPEIAGFHKALDDLVRREDMTTTEMDAAAEILICLKLLRLPLRPQAQMMRRRLIDRQNPDGSWGSDEEPTGAKIHNTAVAAMALLDFAPEFRKGDIYCDSVTYPREHLPQAE